MGSSATSPHAGLAPRLRLAAAAACALAAGCASAPLPPLPLPGKAPAGMTGSPAPDAGAAAPTLTLRPGDAVTLLVYGRPELTLTTAVADDGTITVPLAGMVPVADLSPAKAGQRVAMAFRQGRFLLDPQVTLSLANSRGNQVSVLGAVKAPGRFVIEPRTTVLDVLAQAGGITEYGSAMVVLLRPDKNGKVARHAIDLKGLSQGRMTVPALALRGGDSLFVPPAEQFYILGEVKAPNMYRLEPGMTVVQAISRGGGITPRGSTRRIEIKRRQPDGSYATGSARLGDALQADDVIQIKERLF